MIGAESVKKLLLSSDGGAASGFGFGTWRRAYTDLHQQKNVKKGKNGLVLFGWVM